MASDQVLRAIIAVLDQTAEPIKAIDRRFNALSSPVREVGGHIAELGELTGLSKISERAAEAGEHVRGLGEGLADMAGPLAALGAAGSAAGLFEIAKGAAETEETLALLGPTTGLAAQDLAGWQYAAKLAKVDADQLGRGFGYLNREIADAAVGKNKDVAAILRNMGLSNTPGHLVATADALKAVAAEAQQLVASGNIQVANEMMGKLFGDRAGLQLLPLFDQGPDKILEKIAAAKTLGLAPSDKDIAAGAEFADTYKQMEGAVDGVKLAIGNGLFPVLTPIIDSMKEWLITNRQWLADDIGAAARHLADDLKTVDWKGFGKDLDGIAKSAAWVVDTLGGVGPTAAVIAAISLSPTILAFGKLGVAVGTTAVKFGLFPVAALIYDFARLIPTIAGLRDAQLGLNLAMDANPIGVVIVAAAALAGVAYEVYEHWSELGAFFDRLWKGIPGPVREGIKIVAAVVAPFISIPLEIYRNWGDIAAFFDRTWKSIAATFEAGWAQIKPIVDALKDPGAWAARELGLGGASSGGAAPAPGAKGVNQLSPPLRQLVAPAGPAMGAQSSAKVVLSFENPPPGMTVKTVETKGNPQLDMNLGYAHF